MVRNRYRSEVRVISDPDTKKTVTGAASKPSEPLAPPGDATESFESRIIEARARREKALAERAANTPRNDAKRAAKPPAHAEKLAVPQGKPVLTKIQKLVPVPAVERITRISVTKNLAAKAVLVFMAAAGFGMGSTFAARLFNDAATTTTARIASANVATEADVPESPTNEPSAAPLLTVSADKKAMQIMPFTDVSQPRLETPDISKETVAPELVSVTAAVTRTKIDPIYTDTQRDFPNNLDVEMRKLAALTEATPPPSIFIHAPDGIADSVVAGYVAQLEASGTEVARIGREPFRISTTHLRFYSEDNREDAQALAQSLDIEARDFSQSAAPLDRIEIWVAGQPAQVSKTRSDPSNLLQRLFQNIVDGP